MDIILSKDVEVLSAHKQAYLKALGLSNHEILTYTVLAHEQRDLSVQEIASKLFVFPSALYRILSTLEEKRLIYRIGKRPLKYRALEDDGGFQAAYQVSQAGLSVLLAAAIGRSSGAETRIVIGRQATYDEYVRLANSAKESILIYAIGIAYTKKLHQTQEIAIKRGVKIRHVVQQRKPANYHVIHKWLKLGVQLRLQRTERGFHFTQVDGESTIITFSNPENTDERLSILTTNPQVANHFGRTFEDIWDRSQELEL